MYEYKKYRVEWVIEVCCETDQYGMPDKQILYSKPYPSRELAEAGLKEIMHPDKYVKDRPVWNDAPHSNCYCHVRYREVEVKMRTFLTDDELDALINIVGDARRSAMQFAEWIDAEYRKGNEAIKTVFGTETFDPKEYYTKAEAQILALWAKIEKMNDEAIAENEGNSMNST